MIPEVVESTIWIVLTWIPLEEGKQVVLETFKTKELAEIAAKKLWKYNPQVFCRQFKETSEFYKQMRGDK